MTKDELTLGDKYEHNLTHRQYTILEVKGDRVKLESKSGVISWTARERFEENFKKIK
jgi:hypothetical protein